MCAVASTCEPQCNTAVSSCCKQVVVMQDDKRLGPKKAGIRADVSRLTFKGGVEEEEQAAEA